MELSDIVEKLKKGRSLFSLQDIILAVLCLSATYLLRSRQTYDIKPSWHWDQNLAYYRNGNFPRQEEKLPAPRVTDLDGDGTSELLILTYDLKLEVYSAPAVCDGDCTVLPYLTRLRSTSLNVSADDKPVVMETGFIESMDENNETQSRYQVIVILTSGLDVLCYNNDLDLMWKTHLLDINDPEGHYKIKSVSILVTSHALKKRDQGSVFVGVSFQHTAPKLYNKRESHSDKPLMRQMGMGFLGRQDIPDDDLEHFSTFALHGKSGTIRWHHLPGDFHVEKPKSNDEGFFEWKLTIHDRMAHVGEEHWTKYIKYILSHLPHQWSQSSDTKLELTSLMKSDGLPKSKESKKPAEHSMTPFMDILGLEEDHIEGLPFGGMMPHNKHEHVKVASALLIHNHNGIQVLNMKNGSPITQMKADNVHCVYADINDDGVLDSVCVEPEACLIQAQMVYPNTNLIFSGPTCEAPSLFSSATLMATVTSHKYNTEDPRSCLPPVLVKSIGKRDGLMNHLLGHTLPQKNEAYDSLVLTSSGRLTSYSHNGHLNWQVLVPVGWDPYFISQAVHSPYSRDERNQLYEEVFQPSLTPMSYLVFGRERLGVAVGWSSISLVDLYDGYLLAEHSLPCQPIHRPVIGDFDSNGRNDLIITCNIGHIGFTLEKQPNYLYTLVVGVVIVLSINLLSWCCKPEDEEEEDTNGINAHETNS